MFQFEKSPSWDRTLTILDTNLSKLNEIGFRIEGFPFNEGFPKITPVGKVYQLVLETGECLIAEPGFARELSGGGFQWNVICRGVKSYEESSVASWCERIIPEKVKDSEGRVQCHHCNTVPAFQKCIYGDQVYRALECNCKITPFYRAPTFVIAEWGSTTYYQQPEIAMAIARKKTPSGIPIYKITSSIHGK